LQKDLPSKKSSQFCRPSDSSNCGCRRRTRARVRSLNLSRSTAAFRRTSSSLPLVLARSARSHACSTESVSGSGPFASPRALARSVRDSAEGRGLLVTRRAQELLAVGQAALLAGSERGVMGWCGLGCYARRAAVVRAGVGPLVVASGTSTASASPHPPSVSPQPHRVALELGSWELLGAASRVVRASRAESCAHREPSRARIADRAQGAATAGPQTPCATGPSSATVAQSSNRMHWRTVR
jgi:hypothetical protein